MTKKHTYGFINKISSYFMATMSIVSVVIGLLFIYAAINYFFIDKDTLTLVLFIIGIFLACIVWSPVAFIFLAYLVTDIDVDDKGLSFQFLWKKLSVMWSEILDIKHIRPLGLFTNKYSHIVVVNSKLTFIHHVYGLIYGGAYRPAILIHRNISDHDLLIKNISLRARKNHEK